MKNNLLFVLMLLLCSAFNISAQDLLNEARNQIRQQATEYNLNSRDVASFRLMDHNVSRTSNVAHYYFQQEHRGILINNAIASVHLLEDGTILKINNKFQSKLVARIKGLKPVLTAAEAIQSVIDKYGYVTDRALEIVQNETGIDRSWKFQNEDISKRDIPVRLMYQPMPNGEIKLAWDLSILEPTQTNWWSIRVDAVTGEILHRNNWMLSCEFGDAPYARIKDECPEDANPHLEHNCTHNHAIAPTNSAALVGSYNVYPYPIESPNYGTRSIVTDPDDATASLFGWHDTDGAAGAEFTITRGNNCHAYEDGDNQGYSPDGGAALNFDFPINTTYSTADQSEDAALTNLFYWTNIFHDMWYQYGFDEASGNFQENNYGNGGAGGDSVNAEAQDGSGTCNANFGTPSDGGNPTMQMYICGNRDGDLDNGVIAHEIGHGFSNRLTGGASAAGCLGNQEQMGEGWSDWFGMVMTIELGDVGTDSRGMGTWLTGAGPNGNGIRTHPYSTNLAINPHTYDDINSESVPHGVGSVWCAMLWEVTWALIDEYGFDTDFYTGTGGNNIAMALVTEGMKLQPCSPGFVDGRDAILAADQALYAGANQCLIWEAFAKRGLGVSADQGSSASRSDGTEAFDTPGLSIEKTVDLANATNGDVLTYTLTITNPPLCNTTFTNVVISDDLPTNTTYVSNSASDGGTESGGVVTFPAIATVLPGATLTRTFSVSIDAGFQTLVPNINDDVENGTANWDATSSNAGLGIWATNTTNPNSGSTAWFAPDIGQPLAQYLELASPAVLDATSQLTFFHSYDTEATWDGGLVQISTNGGDSWSDLGPFMTQNGYNSTVNNSASQPAFSGNSGGYIQTIVDLSSFADQVASIRFFMYCDQSVDGNGWFIDDITLNDLRAFIPNTATLTADGGFTASDALDIPTIVENAQCTNGIQDGDETDVDCGGTSCPACPTCDDGILNQDETGIDCGGTICPVCPTCDDGIQNQGETDIDCGGNNCPACPTCDDGILNQGETEVDCGGLNCPACPTCDDGIQNGDETDVDCGGSTCDLCPCDGTNVSLSITFDDWPEDISWEIVDDMGVDIYAGGSYENEPNGSTIEFVFCLDDGCYDLQINDSYGDGLCCQYGDGGYTLTDIDNNIALASGATFTTGDTTNFCLTTVVPTCSDGIQNGDETGIDCGGTLCTACPTCNDGIQNGDETDIDCGGTVCPVCPTCNDGVQNGDETGIDCGGTLCPACPTCDDGIQNGDETGIDCGGTNCPACTYPIAWNMNLEGTWDGATVAYNDIWGYVDEQNNEYAVIGSRTKVHFIDVTNPAAPSFVAEFDGNWAATGITGANSSWRDFKTYDRYVYAVADVGTEGLMVFDMSALPEDSIVKANQDNTVFSKAHNIYIDACNGKLYVVGSNASDLIIYDVAADPINPPVLFNGSVDGGYIHDIFVQDNIAYASSGFDGLYILDVNDPTNPTFQASINTGGYNHSSWITEDGTKVVYAEEVPAGLPMGVIDITDAANNNLTMMSTFKDPLELTAVNNIYHNPYIVDNYLITSSYEDGITMFDLTDPSNVVLAGYYDTYTGNNGGGYTGYNGAWGVYPFFPSGTIVGSDIQTGLYVLSTTNITPLTTDCGDGMKSKFEEGIDCGGFCAPCIETCSDGIQNQDETGVDCGGASCPACETCDDGIQNQDETGIDCGGASCPTCPDDCLFSISLNGTITSNTYQAEEYIYTNGLVLNGSNVTLRAGNYIDMVSDFEVELGAEFLAEIQACPSVLTDSDEDITQIDNDVQVLFDPATKQVGIQYQNISASKLLIQNIQGAMIDTINLDQNIFSQTLTWDSSNVPAGLYIILLEHTDGRKQVKKIIIE